jgi:3-oxoacyl-[acyl-carrier-protein] synthase-3
MRDFIPCYLRTITASYGSGTRSNEDLVALNPNWSPESICAKVGISSRPIAAEGESAIDLAERAARESIEVSGLAPLDIDVLILVTQSPDYILPSSACILQHRLGLPETVRAFDVGLGCSGFNYGLWLARSIILSGAGSRVLLICAETYSRYCDLHDLATVTLFGDGAAAAILQSEPENAIALAGDSLLGTDGSGAGSLIVRSGGGRSRAEKVSSTADAAPVLEMDGPAVFRFALDRAFSTCNSLLQRLQLTWTDIDMVLCHQANRFMLQALQRQFGLSDDQMPIDVQDIGNLSTASLPVHIARLHKSGRLNDVSNTIALGFGVGLSWGATFLKWTKSGF